MDFCEQELKISMTSKLKPGQSASGRVTADGKKKIHESWPGAVCSTLMDNHEELLQKVSALLVMLVAPQCLSLFAVYYT